MADEVPVELKQADLSLWKTATKAAQLQSIKPIIAYWCDYWVVNQILAKELHNTDNAIMTYTLSVMDRLERTKTDYASEEAITDDIAGQAYVEQFAQETLDRAERVIKANKVTVNTAQTFDAALTFFNLVNIWGPPDGETIQKIKYAKWNAARIAKALREGVDPNESNPKQGDLVAVEAPQVDEAELKSVTEGGSEGGPKPATVEEVPDAALPNAPGAEDPDVSVPTPPSGGDDLQLPSAPGYAEQVTPTAEDGELKLPPAPGYATQPTKDPGYFSPPPQLPSPISPAEPPAAPAFFSSPNTAPQTAATPSPPAIQPPPPVQPTQAVPRPAIPPPSAPVPRTAPTRQGAQPVAAPIASNGDIDEAAMGQAQKHAKWAISALNFEDVPTAVRELRKALQMLGAG